MTDELTSTGPGGAVGAKGARRCAPPVTARAEAFLTRTMKPFELVSEEGLEILEHNADTILEEVGVEIRDYPSAVERFRDAGADVDGDRVRFPRGMAARSCRRRRRPIYTQHARNPERSVQVGGDATVFAPNYGSPFAHDLDNGRRYATIADFQNFVKLAYMSPYLHHSGGTVCEPVDVPVSKRHLDMVYAHLKLQRQAVHGLGHGRRAGRRLGRAGTHRLRRRPRTTAR